MSRGKQFSHYLRDNPDMAVWINENRGFDTYIWYSDTGFVGEAFERNRKWKWEIEFSEESFRELIDDMTQAEMTTAAVRVNYIRKEDIPI